ncbi:MAG TPA: SLC13 family permease [Acidobacteriota bacterium]|nr:SLC13 family permease [Acidobacteriota bacterium]
MITVQGIVTLAVLGIALILFTATRLRPDLVALVVVATLGAIGVLTPQEAFSGFSSPAIVTIISIYVLAQGLYLTGVSTKVADFLVRASGSSERQLVLVVMAAGAFLSLFMNNIAAASVLMPALSSVSTRKAVNPSRLLIPLAYSTILGGMATLFTTANIISSGVLRQHQFSGFNVLDFLPVGGPVVLLGILFMVVWGRKLLPARTPTQRLAETSEPHDLTDVYRLDERLFRARVPEGSALHNKPLSKSTLRENFNLNVVAIESAGFTLLAPAPDTILHTGDVLTLEGSLDEFKQRDVEPYLEIFPQKDFRESDLESAGIIVAEIVLTPRSSLIGKTLQEVNFREKYNYSVLAIWREGRPIRRGMSTTRLEFGDALLIQGPRARLRILRSEPDMLLLSEEEETTPTARPGRLWFSVSIMTAAIVVAALGIMPTSQAMLIGGILMVLFGCLTADEAYAAIEWKSVVLVAGMLSMGLALTKTGIATVLSDQLIAGLGPYGHRAVLAGFFVIGALLTQVIGGSAVAALLTPLAIQAALRFHGDPHGLAMGVALSASMAFLTPLSHPVNVLVMGPGAYKFTDYLKAGLPLAIIVGIAILLILPLFWTL